MQIENLHSEIKENKATVVATVIWEDCDRPTREIYFATSEEFVQDIDCNPHAFLTACILPAMRHGEKRVAIDADICPELRKGLLTAMDIIRTWYEYDDDHQPVQIEARTKYVPNTRLPQRAGSFLSGGLDSLATLRGNRLDFSLEHPASIKDGLIVYGFDIGGYEQEQRENASNSQEAFQRTLTILSRIAQDSEVTLIPVYTNIKYLDDDLHFWMYEFHGAALAAVAHAFAKRLTRVYIASSHDTRTLVPWGSHPVLDSNYSSANLRIQNDGIRLLSRWEKMKILADWDVVLQNLRVCTHNISGLLNCGQCEKCIRTMMALVAIGNLKGASAFPVDDVSPELFMQLEKISDATDYTDLLDALRVQGRLDLIEAIEKKIPQLEETDWKGRIKRFDRKYLGSNLVKLRQLSKK